MHVAALLGTLKTATPHHHQHYSALFSAVTSSVVLGNTLYALLTLAAQLGSWRAACKFSLVYNPKGDDCA
jgi:hypothetical protein